MRVEMVEETTPGTPPTDPSWTAFARGLNDITVSTDGQKEPQTYLGSADNERHTRGPEEAGIDLTYPMEQFPLDNSGTVVDPAGYPIDATGPSDIPHLTYQIRREVSDGGALGAGFREYAVAFGARPISLTSDGDPSESSPLPQEVSNEAKRARVHIIHQPSSTSTLVIRSTDASDTNDVVVESEGGSQTATETLPGSDPNTVATSVEFDDVDAIWVKGDHAGDIQVGTDDGTGAIDTELLSKPLTGTNTDGVDSIRGIPPTGSGSHGTPPSEDGTLFLGTSSEWADAAVGERVHALNLSVEWETSREPLQGTRMQAIDVGGRTAAEVDADLAGPFETADLIAEYYRDKVGDLVYGFSGAGDPSNASKYITLHNGEITDTPDHTRSADDVNYLPSVTIQGKADDSNPAISITNSS